MLKGVLFFCLLVLNASKVNAQEPLSALQESLFEKINVERLGKGSLILVYDSLLYKAALDHADYLKKTKKLTHVQKSSKSKRTPKNRVWLYAKQYEHVGENVLSYTTSKDYSIDQITDKMLKLWVGSKEHYQNMLLPSHVKSAIAISYNAKKQTYFAVQVFTGKAILNSDNAQ